MTKGYVELHAASAFSFLDAASLPEQLIERAAELGIRSISDLRKHPKLKIGMSAPFLDRPDGWRSLREVL